MEPLDGNAVAGELFEHFRAEMTTAAGTCGHCGAGAAIGELAVYGRPPGAVARCRSCGNVVIGIVNARQTTLVNIDKFRLEDPGGAG
jgi:hypothetical protein